jgi:hypothetical protein
MSPSRMLMGDRRGIAVPLPQEVCSLSFGGVNGSVVITPKTKRDRVFEASSMID